MLITCLGHAKFLIELESGLRIVTDPFDASCGYPVASVQADVVLISHGHHDHSAVETVSGAPQVIRTAGVHTVAPEVTVTAVSAWHDDQQGALRGETLLFLIEAEGLRLAHLGDLGHLPLQAHIDALAPLDVLMLPVGGHYTIDASQAKKTAELLRAQVILPMHYRTGYNSDWPIAPAEDFTALYPDVQAERLPLLRVCAEDMVCQPRIAVLDAQTDDRSAS